MKILILFGPPYSGKGTQGKLLAENINYVHVSTGNILREEKKLGTEIGIIAQEYSKKGLLVPDDLLEKILGRELQKNIESEGIILDGYPRTIAQANTLKRLSQNFGAHIQKVLSLEVSEDELINRAIERGKTSDRDDDKNPEIIRKRIEVYHTETKPVADFYAKLDLVELIHGQGDPNEITGRLKRVI